MGFPESMLLFKPPKETFQLMLVENRLRCFSLHFIAKAHMVNPVAKQPYTELFVELMT